MNTVNSLEHRQQIRRAELELVLSYLNKQSVVLEIGAGAGWQAEILSNYAATVHAIDIPSSNYNQVRIWPVIDYDGEHIPLPTNSVDVVFSSNVLEHVPHIEQFQTEIMRVLKPNGIAVHIMPTPVWRFWTSLSLYLDRAKKCYELLTRKLHKSVNLRSNNSVSHPRDIQQNQKQTIMQAAKPKRSIQWWITKFVRLLWPTPHGVRGNVATELYYFSENYWTELFKKTGWNVLETKPNGLFYTGNRVFGHRLSIKMRNTLSKILGSSCRVYVLCKPLPFGADINNKEADFRPIKESVGNL